MEQYYNKKLIILISLGLASCHSGISSSSSSSSSSQLQDKKIQDTKINSSQIVAPTSNQNTTSLQATQVSLGSSPKFVYDGIKIFNRFAASSFPMLNKILGTYADIFPPASAANHSKEYFEKTIAAIAQVQESVDKISSNLADFHQQYTADQQYYTKSNFGKAVGASGIQGISSYYLGALNAKKYKSFEDYITSTCTQNPDKTYKPGEALKHLLTDITKQLPMNVSQIANTDEINNILNQLNSTQNTNLYKSNYDRVQLLNLYNSRYIYYFSSSMAALKSAEEMQLALAWVISSNGPKLLHDSDVHFPVEMQVSSQKTFNQNADSINAYYGPKYKLILDKFKPQSIKDPIEPLGLNYIGNDTQDIMKENFRQTYNINSFDTKTIGGDFVDHLRYDLHAKDLEWLKIPFKIDESNLFSNDNNKNKSVLWFKVPDAYHYNHKFAGTSLLVKTSYLKLVGDYTGGKQWQIWVHEKSRANGHNVKVDWSFTNEQPVHHNEINSVIRINDELPFKLNVVKEIGNQSSKNVITAATNQSIELRNPSQCFRFNCNQAFRIENHRTPWNQVDSGYNKDNIPVTGIIEYNRGKANLGKLYYFGISYGSYLHEAHYNEKSGWGWYDHNWEVEMYPTASIVCLTPNCTKEGNTIKFSNGVTFQLKNHGNTRFVADPEIIVKGDQYKY